MASHVATRTVGPCLGSAARSRLWGNPQAAIVLGDQAALEAWLANGGSVNVWNQASITLLMTAAVTGRDEMAEMLIARRAALDLQGRDGKTALMLAAFMGHTAVVSRLLAVGARTELCDNGGKTALALAELRGHFETTRILRSAENKARALAHMKRHTKVVGFVAKCRAAWDEVRYRPGNSGYIETLFDIQNLAIELHAVAASEAAAE